MESRVIVHLMKTELHSSLMFSQSRVVTVMTGDRRQRKQDPLWFKSPHYRRMRDLVPPPLRRSLI